MLNVKNQMHTWMVNNFIIVNVVKCRNSTKVMGQTIFFTLSSSDYLPQTFLSMAMGIYISTHTAE
jgi:hypothetical protein